MQSKPCTKFCKNVSRVRKNKTIIGYIQSVLQGVFVNKSKGAYSMKLTKEMQEVIGDELAWIATVNNDGTPDLGPKRTMRVLDDEHLIFCENTDGQHHANIKANGKIVVGVAKRFDNVGFRFVGKATSYTDSEHMELAKEKAGVMPKAAAIIIDIEKIYTLNSGPLAGKPVEE